MGLPTGKLAMVEKAREGSSTVMDKPFRQAELARAVNSVRAPSRQNGMIYFSPPVDRL